MPSQILFTLLTLTFCSPLFASAYDGVHLDFHGFKVLGTGPIEKGLDNDYDEYMKLEGNLDPETEAIFTYNPLGTHKGTPTSQCQQQDLNKLIQESPDSSRELSESIQNWLDACRDSIHEYSRLGALINLARVKYRMVNHPLLLRVELQLNNGVRIKGLLGLKDLTNRRPLVVSKCGIYCDALSSYTVNNTTMHLFDESPFNLLILANTTGQSFAKDNGVVAMGGFDGGEQMIQSIEILLSEASTLKHLISTIHLHGLSLGGNDALMAGVYASYQPQLPIKSVIASCPVIDLNPTLDSIFESGLRGTFYRVLSLLHLRKVFSFVPILKDLLDPDHMFNWDRQDIKNAFINGALDYYKKRTSEHPWPRAPFAGVQIESIDQLAYLNNFINHTDKIRIPTTVIYSQDDQMVSPSLNGRQLKQKLKTSPNPSIGVIETYRGNHCAFSTGIGWNLYSNLLRNTISKYSDLAQEPAHEVSIDIGPNIKYWQVDEFLGKKIKKLPGNEVVLKTEFKLKQDKNQYELFTYVFDPDRTKTVSGKIKRRCKNQDPFHSYDWCVKKYRADLSVDTLNELNLWDPKTTLDKYRLSRWLNVNGELEANKGQKLVGGHHFPKFLSFSRKIDYAGNEFN